MDYRTYQDVAREYAREDKDPRDVFSKFLSDGLGSPKNFPAFDKIFTPRLAEKPFVVSDKMRRSLLKISNRMESIDYLVRVNNAETADIIDLIQSLIVETISNSLAEKESCPISFIQSLFNSFDNINEHTTSLCFLSQVHWSKDIDPKEKNEEFIAFKKIIEKGLKVMGFPTDDKEDTLGQFVDLLIRVNRHLDEAVRLQTKKRAWEGKFHRIAAAETCYMIEVANSVFEEL
ncbi:MAG: hypothetical protein Q4B65_02245 [Candidatus Saccharibacteria bacterium]|nr:hypothetical protein [Candidatus Saccharibacteria bacterium]